MSEPAKTPRTSLLPGAMAQDKALHAKFDKIARNMPTGEVAKPKRKKVLRQRGRPKNGFVSFSAEQIDELPDVAHLSKVAQVLGVKHTSLQQWCDKDDQPLPFVLKDGHRWFRKDVLVNWLTQTKRIV